MRQTKLFEVPADQLKPRRWTTTFAENVALPTHNWFRYSAGFSGRWARETLLAAKAEGRQHVLDPFAGAGTTILESASLGLASIGVDAHPFVGRIAQAKLCWLAEPGEFYRRAMEIVQVAATLTPRLSHPSELIERCFPPETLGKLNALRDAYNLIADGSIYSELIWLALISILREVSPVGTASWQYVLPKKSKVNVADAFEAFEDKVELMRLDMDEMSMTIGRATPNAVHVADARTLNVVPDGWADFIVTSPPYANNYDYADAVRLEMSFLGEIDSWSDLHPKVRKHLICSCSQHASKERLLVPAEAVLANPNLEPIRVELAEVCRKLEIEKDLHAGNKAYDLMMARYFSDMAYFLKSLRRVSTPGARAVLVIGDSAPYGIHAPVNRWLGELALSVGFHEFHFDKKRDRNIKWKNRKHTVPLQEGELWIEG